MTLPLGSWCIWLKLGTDARQGAGKRLELDSLFVTGAGLDKKVEQLGWLWPKLGGPEIYSAWRGAHEPLAGRVVDGSGRPTLYQRPGQKGLGGKLAHKLAALAMAAVWCTSGAAGFWAAHVGVASVATWAASRRPNLTWGMTNVICRHLVIINGNANQKLLGLLKKQQRIMTILKVGSKEDMDILVVLRVINEKGVLYLSSLSFSKAVVSKWSSYQQYHPAAYYKCSFSSPTLVLLTQEAQQSVESNKPTRWFWWTLKSESCCIKVSNSRSWRLVCEPTMEMVTRLTS